MREIMKRNFSLLILLIFLTGCAESIALLGPASTSSLTGFTGSARIKKHPTATTSKSFSVSIISSTGEVSIAMTSGVTAGLDPGRHVYDVRLESPSGAVTRMVEGMAFVTAGITTN